MPKGGEPVISKNTDNVKEDALNRLLASYVVHGFVIDREEAATLFCEVREPSPEELQLWGQLSSKVAEGQANDLRDEPAVVIPVSIKMAKRSADHDDNDSTKCADKEPGLAQATARQGPDRFVGPNGGGGGKEPVAATNGTASEDIQDS